MSTFVSTYPTARKRHACNLCNEGIRPGEKYRRGVGFDGTAWTWKECLWCERAAATYMRTAVDEEYFSHWIIEWLAADHPTVYALMRAGWSYPDGERVPLPFQRRCIACGVLLHGDWLWCPPCDAERIARIRCANPMHVEPVTTRENLLRGETLAAANIAKTQCPQGHAYTNDNILWKRDGRTRACRECNRIYLAKRRETVA